MFIIYFNISLFLGIRGDVFEGPDDELNGGLECDEERVDKVFE